MWTMFNFPEKYVKPKENDYELFFEKTEIWMSLY